MLALVAPVDAIDLVTLADEELIPAALYLNATAAGKNSAASVKLALGAGLRRLPLPGSASDHVR
ncbi:MAG: hypothetical protein ACREQN_06390 [Candidatus Binataceae bacterium]